MQRSRRRTARHIGKTRHSHQTQATDPIGLFRCRCVSARKICAPIDIVSASPVPTDKSHPQFLIFFHQMVSTYLGGRLMPQPTQGQKVLGNSRLRPIAATK